MKTSTSILPQISGGRQSNRDKVTWLAGGVLLWRRQALGYAASAGLLYVASILFAGVSLVIAFPALTSGAPLDVGGVISMLVMAAICIVPLALYIRGIVRS